MIPVIDLFAGPGGLGEGFSAYHDKSGQRAFRIVLSIEKDEAAHKTLRLRSFFRQFDGGNVPEEYYDCLRGKLSIDSLFAAFPLQAECAGREAWCAELGNEREFSAEEIDKRICSALGGAKDWILIGGPPCQAYSIVGRSRMIPVDRRKYEKDHRHFLYREYLRILAAHQPPVFVMENVTGILSSKMDGKRIIDRIFADLRQPLAALPELERQPPVALEYELHALTRYESPNALFASLEPLPSDYVIRCETHGIPQARHRLILLGIRKDQNCSPDRLRGNSNEISMWRAIKDLPKIRSRLSREKDSPEQWQMRIQEFLDTEPLKNGALPRELRREIRACADKLRPIKAQGGEFVESTRKPNWNASWFYDHRLGGVCNHSARKHMKTDLWRYFFAISFARCVKRSPHLLDFPDQLLPNHRNIEDLENGDEIAFKDRFRVQVKHRPSTTITSHIAKDGHYFIHPDPAQCRSLTVREAARLQTFPDNYYFVGHRTKQYQQVGNAVPPLLAHKIARIVHKLLSKPGRK
jgi:DNA (cytosine-5)-methyltransferase 1